MMFHLFRVAGLLAVLLPIAPAAAGPLDFNLGLSVPPIVFDSKAPPSCTVTWLVENTANNDVFAARMRIAPSGGETPVNGRMPCPTDIPPRVPDRALAICTSHAADPKSCVFADAARGFETRPDLLNTAENGSRCTSDKATQIALACWMAGGLAVCNVGCGSSEAAAKQSAQARCEDKQRRSCAIRASVPVSAP